MRWALAAKLSLLAPAPPPSVSRPAASSAIEEPAALGRALAGLPSARVASPQPKAMFLRQRGI